MLNGEIFYSLKEATVVIEQWRKHYNAIRPALIPELSTTTSTDINPGNSSRSELSNAVVSIPPVQNIRQVTISSAIRGANERRHPKLAALRGELEAIAGGPDRLANPFGENLRNSKRITNEFCIAKG